MSPQTHYAQYKCQDAALLQRFVEHVRFACIVAQGEEGYPCVAYAPLLIERGAHHGMMLEWHLARRNPLAALLQSATKVAVSVQGPHAHISPSWHLADAQRNKTAPTWDYIAATLEGKVSVLPAVALDAHLERLVRIMETPLAGGWSKSELDADTSRRWQQAIIGFSMPVSRFDFTVKLSQERSVAERQGIARGLKSRQKGWDDILSRIIEQCDDNADTVSALQQWLLPLKK